MTLLDRLPHWERLEDLSKNFGLPFISEYELEFYRKLLHAELREALLKAKDLAWRGRLRRLMGDKDGAAVDLKQALDLDPSHAAAHLWLGELDLMGPGAEESLSRGIALDKKLGWGYLYRGARRFLVGDAKAAAADLRAFTRLKPGSCLGHLLLGRALEQLRRPAATSFRAAAEADPSCSAAWLCLGKVERAIDADPIYALITLSKYKPGRDWQAHLKWLRKFAFEEPERAGWYYRQDDIHYSPYQLEEFADSVALARAKPGSAWANALVTRGAFRCPPDKDRLATGMAAVQKAARLRPESGWIRAWRGLAHMKAGRPREALADIEDCIRLQPFYHRAYAWRAGLLRKMGRLPQALADMDRAVRVDEQYSFVVHERSLARRALGDFVGAAADMDAAFRIDWRYSWVFTVGREPTAAEFSAGLKELGRALAACPRSASLWAWRGQLHLQMREFARAYADLEEAVHLDPRHALAQGFYGKALLEEGQVRRALEHLARAAELEPGVLIFRGWLARAQEADGRRASAAATLGGILKAKPMTWWAHHQRASLHLVSGRARLAKTDLAAAFRLAGRRYENHYLDAQVRLALGELPAAQTAVGKALTITPSFGRAYLLRAEILTRRGRHQEAVSDYRTALERFPYLFNAEERERVESLLRDRPGE